MSSEITITESRRLIELERKIKTGLNTFVEVGEALLEIRDSRLYRIEHGTFEEYCKDKWNMSKAFAFRQIAAASAIKNLSPIGDTPKPTTESQARPLTKLPAEKQPEAWAKAVESADGKQPTAKQVEAAVVEVIAPASKPKPKATTKFDRITAQKEIEFLTSSTLQRIADDDELSGFIMFLKSLVEKAEINQIKKQTK